MMNRIIQAIGALAVAVGLAALAASCSETTETQPQPSGGAVAQAGTPQTTCPAMGGKIDKELYVDHDGKRIYMCCPACTDKIKQDPAKYIKKLEDAGVTLAKAAATGHEGHDH